MSDAQSLYAPNWLTCPDHPAELNRTIWTDSFQRNHGGELTIDGIAASELVEEFDTPQYVFRKTHSGLGHAGTAGHSRMPSPGMGRRRVSTTRESHSCAPPWRGGRMRKDCALIRRRAGNWRLPCGHRFPGKISRCTVITSRMTRLSAPLNTG